MMMLFLYLFIFSMYTIWVQRNYLESDATQWLWMVSQDPVECKNSAQLVWLICKTLHTHTHTHTHNHTHTSVHTCVFDVNTPVSFANHNFSTFMQYLQPSNTCLHTYRYTKPTPHHTFMLTQMHAYKLRHLHTGKNCKTSTISYKWKFYICKSNTETDRYCHSCAAWIDHHPSVK